jgi:hypothetical protein
VAKQRRPKRSEDYYMQRMLQSFALAKMILFLIAIALLYIPIKATVPLAHELAGKDTKLVASFSITVVISLGSLAGVITTVLRSRGRKAELERLRGKCEGLEAKLGKKG